MDTVSDIEGQVLRGMWYTWVFKSHTQHKVAVTHDVKSAVQFEKHTYFISELDDEHVAMASSKLA